ncbi:pilus assembly protein TadE [Stenotrophomonas sp. HMSC10F06]|uniref:pilus assembly protein TadE n=1 Tax=Stenotrophomonas sp. HMSC10F06 TaxID=1581081 RepID=UPI0008A103A8|nr:pilus assembly protein TadE [Stenotrophomonas sp. HMSC10F06]OFS96510.1 pilus assembly protein TadE [Stenotrophomonas sp. HMSC10F06]
MSIAAGHLGRPTRQRGIATLEFALMLLFGLLPLLLVTYSGVMIMAAQQTLSAASAEGARAAFRHATQTERRTAACVAARRSMQWLLTYARQTPDCAAAGAPPITVSTPAPCADLPAAQCIRVEVSYDYRAHPFLPGTGRVYGWVMPRALRSTAVAQLDLGGN